jgi:hypothetical protein
LPGAALATACAVSALFLSGLLQVRYVLGLWPYDRRYLKGLAAAASAAATLLLLRTAEVGPPTLSLILMASTSIGVFGVTLLLLGPESEDREFVHLVQARLREAQGAS